MSDRSARQGRVTLTYLWAKAVKKLRGTALRGSTVHPSSKVEPGTQFVFSVMGRHSFCGYDCDISHADIGSFCSIANGVVIGGGMHPVSWISSSPAFYAGRDSIRAKFAEHAREPVRRTRIGHDVWIGQNALIKQGITIGTGAVIGMGAVVTKDVAPYAIVAGNPARLIRLRFPAALVDALLQSEWWELPEARLRALGHLATDPAAFLLALRA